AADEEEPKVVNLNVLLKEGAGKDVHTHYTIKYKLPEKELTRFAFSSSGGDIPEGRYSRLLGRRGYPFGVLCEFTPETRTESLVELDAIISVLGPPVQKLDEGIVFAEQSMRVPLNMVPGKSVKIDLPRDWFVRTLNAEMLKTKDGPIWIELTVEPRAAKPETPKP
ncbi:MAG TPA: hypothetical protein VL096_06425, partial [Pirellulaceae bacterium]|nr:hypothetical protein [Pirellulaceae bacterium]